MKSDRVLGVCLLLVVLATVTFSNRLEALTISMSTDKPQEMENTTEDNQTDPVEVPEAVTQAVKADIVQNNDVDTEELEIAEAEKNLWSDGCLGLAAEGELCTQALVPGYRLSITDGENTWVYRTDEAGITYRIEG